MSRQDLDEMARRRCVLVLSLLSGEMTLAEAAEAAQCSPLTLQKYERRALEAMLAALAPDASADGIATSTAQKIADLETRIAQLERDKRRAERLLQLTRQMVRPGPITTGAGRRPGSHSRRKSAAAGAKSSPTSTTMGRRSAASKTMTPTHGVTPASPTTTASSPTSVDTESAPRVSRRTPDGEVER